MSFLKTVYCSNTYIIVPFSLLDLVSLVILLVEEHMKDILKEIQEKMDEKLEALTREMQKIIERNSGEYKSQ